MSTVPSPFRAPLFEPMNPTRQRAFTLMEMMVSTAVFTALGLIIYGVASEGLIAFSRNISINRSYTEARQSLDQIGLSLQTAGYKPYLVDATGAITTVSPAAGIRFWRNGPTPCYDIVTPTLTSSTLVLSLLQHGSTSVYQPAPAVGDLITIPALAFQARVTAVTATATIATVSFSGTINSNTPGTLTSVPVTDTTTKPPTVISYYCMDWSSVAFIAVGTQLRYYRNFLPGTTSITDVTKYKVVTNLVSALGSATPPLPFSLGSTAAATGVSVNVDLYAEAPDYNKRNLGTANTYTFLETALASRNASLLSSPP